MINFLKNSYLLPWSKYNNPNGWIEPTTACQLSCPGCYRGCDYNKKGTHKELTELKKEINFLIEKRNIDTLTISGGEPLLYPHLESLIKYAKRKDLKIMILTNGILLERLFLKKLEKLGIDRIVIHIDKFQKRTKKEDENEVNKIREKYCALFRKSKISLGFIMPISRKNIDDIDILIPFYKQNSDVIELVSFTILQEGVPKNRFKKSGEMEIIRRIKNKYEAEFCAYLPKQLTSEPAWLFSCCAFVNEKKIGCLDSDIVRYLQTKNMKKYGKFSYVINGIPSSFSDIVYYIKNRSIRRIILGYLHSSLKRIGKKTNLNLQTLLIVNTPDKINGKWNLCKSCPDAILYKNELVPSCILERVKKGEEAKIQ